MFPVIFIGLFVSVLSVLAVAFAMFFSVAFENEEQAMFSPSFPDAARLPRRNPEPSRRSLAAASGNISGRQPMWNAENARPEQQISCQHSRTMIPVTAPEVFAITDYLSMSRTREEVELIYQVAETNDHQCTPGHLGCDQPRCPLLKADGGCSVHPVRPQYCRLAERYDTLLDGSAHDVTCVAEDFGPGRQRVGIKETRFELNSALVVALSEPEGEQPWQTRSQLFANCRRVS